jgi:anti-sigma regulatory factor (Ser/Thr protein kinase)
MPPAEATASSRVNAPGPEVSFALCLPRAPVATGDARHVIRRRLGELLAENQLDDVLLVVTELVANALLHGRGEITLQIAFDGRRVSGLVGDDGAGFWAAAREPGSDIGGHGLEIVERLSESWGHADGSSDVTFEIAAPRRR